MEAFHSTSQISEYSLKDKVFTQFKLFDYTTLKNLFKKPKTTIISRNIFSCFLCLEIPVNQHKTVFF